MEGFLKLSTAVNATILMIDSADHITGKTGLSAGLTIYATKAAGTPATITPTVTELDSTNVKGVYKLAFTTGHTDTLGELQIHITATGADPTDIKWQVATYLPGEAATLQADQAVNATKVGGTTQTGRDLGASVLLSSGTGTGQLDFTSGVVKANATQLAGQTITAVAGVTFPTSVASPTNITAGTITTATSVTNDVGITQAGADKVWGTAARTLTSFGTLAADVWAVATRVLTAGTNIVLAKGTGVTGFNDLDAAGVRTAVGLATANLDTQLDALPTAAENADAVWDELTSGHAVSGSTGEALTNAGAAGTPPTAAAVADAVWDEVLSGHLTATTTGAALNAAGAAGDPWVTSLPGAYGAGTAGFIVGTNLDVLISSRTKPADTQAAVTTVTNLTNAPTAGDLTATMKASVTTAATAATPTVAGVTGVTFPASVASPTNITAGTITTVTNLTNAPTAGDFTATMKTSLNASTPAVTVSDKTGYSLSTAGNAAVADKILGRNLATGSDGGRMVKDALRSLRNKTSITAGTLTVTEEDDTTPAWTAVITTSPGDPLTSIDPA